MYGSWVPEWKINATTFPRTYCWTIISWLLAWPVYIWSTHIQEHQSRTVIGKINSRKSRLFSVNVPCHHLADLWDYLYGKIIEPGGPEVPSSANTHCCGISEPTHAHAITHAKTLRLQWWNGLKIDIGTGEQQQAQKKAFISTKVITGKSNSCYPGQCI